MSIRRLLIAPADRIAPPPPPWWQRLKHTLIKPPLVYTGELLFYADIPSILGQSNTFTLGKYYPHLFDPHVPANCPYPSCHGSPPGTAINFINLTSTVKQVDAILVSTNSPYIDSVIREARRHHKPIAIIDFPDHEDLYGTQPTPKQIYRGYQLGQHFDLYFKKDLIPHLANETTLPLEPAPVRPSSYNFPDKLATSPIFYSGRSRMDRVQPDRQETVTLFQRHFPDADITEHDDRHSFMTIAEYSNRLASSRLALSPSGRVWGSFRHCEVGLTPHTALIAPQPYIALAGTIPKDGVNAILYDVEEVNGRYHLKNPDQLINKVKYYLDHDQELLAIARQWKKDVLTTHTITARSQYVLDAIGRLL